jgi:SpoVK/Ycf46/Vps4 family AAA+-type ATPase
MAATIITTEDLIEFKKELLEDIKKIFESQTTSQNKKWLKSVEVRELLNISPGTLQNLRINGTLSYTKIGGIMYYDNQDIDKILEKNKVNSIPILFR